MTPLQRPCLLHWGPGGPFLPPAPADPRAVEGTQLPGRSRGGRSSGPSAGRGRGPSSGRGTGAGRSRGAPFSPGVGRAQGDGHGLASAGEAKQANKRAAAQKKTRDVVRNKIFFTFVSMYCKWRTLPL